MFLVWVLAETDLGAKVSHHAFPSKLQLPWRPISLPQGLHFIIKDKALGVPAISTGYKQLTDM
jgi:hypothetical protein